MNKISKTIAAGAMALMAAGCVEEYVPQTNIATSQQAAGANGAYDNFVNTVTSTLSGQFTYAGSDYRAYDFGYPTFYLMWDCMGQDMVYQYLNWYDSWYCMQQYLGPTYAVTQMPWTYYYKWIKNCNVVLSLAGDEPAEQQKAGAGIALAMRALYYLDMAQMFAPETYTRDKAALTVPIITEKVDNNAAQDNPRATNEEMYAFIISDLDRAEQYLAGHKREDKYSPDISVVYGLKARAYLIMGEWANARKYAKMAQEGYSLLTEAEYTDRNNGFNTPDNGSWMLACHYKEDDPNIKYNDGDSSWGSQMCLEVDPEESGCGYASNYGQFWLIDRHLYETMPKSDFRRKCFVDFALDELATEEEKIEALKAYSDYPESVYNTGVKTSSSYSGLGGLSLKFRLAGGEAGRKNQMIGFCVAVPMMRVEEMYLIEAEAAGMMNEAEGVELLTKFAKTRDAEYEYGKHNEAYGNTANTKFQNEVWWQRRVEFWAEGLATKDIKRYGKGIIRSYAGSNHVDQYRWNTTTTPSWMTLNIVQTEGNYNKALVNNPAPAPMNGNSPEFAW